MKDRRMAASPEAAPKRTKRGAQARWSHEIAPKRTLKKTVRRIDEAHAVFNAKSCDALRLERPWSVGLNGVPRAVRETEGHKEEDAAPS